MSNVRSGKAIKRPIFEQSNNTLILTLLDEDNNALCVEFFSKIEDKIEALELSTNGTMEGVVYKYTIVWVGAKASNIHELDTEDIERLLDNKLENE